MVFLVATSTVGLPRTRSLTIRQENQRKKIRNWRNRVIVFFINWSWARWLNCWLLSSAIKKQTKLVHIHHGGAVAHFSRCRVGQEQRQLLKPDSLPYYISAPIPHKRDPITCIKLKELVCRNRHSSFRVRRQQSKKFNSGEKFETIRETFGNECNPKNEFLEFDETK